MIRRLLLLDTVGNRLLAAMLLVVAFTFLLNVVFNRVAGTWADPPLDRTGLLQRAVDIVSLLDTAPLQIRPKMVETLNNKDFIVYWNPTTSTLSSPGYNATINTSDAKKELVSLLGNGQFPVLSSDKDNLRWWPQTALHEHSLYPHAYAMAVQLRDKSWIVFVVPHRLWGGSHTIHIGIVMFFLCLSTIFVCIVVTRQFTKPIKAFADAARDFGTNPKAPPLVAIGPHEIRIAINAFNAMQVQIQKYITDRTMMLAAISHDLRTPLTRIRLRAEFVEDDEQQKKLFRDVDEMQSMIDAALAFFRDSDFSEESTGFDLAQLLQTIVDDYADQGHEVGYTGYETLIYRGRPLTLKRAFTNLVDNAVKYGSSAEIHLLLTGNTLAVHILDHGPGIPVAELDNVFLPFVRVEGSRNRSTGGVGLGLTITRTIVQSHGGDIALNNRDVGGLDVVIELPVYLNDIPAYGAGRMPYGVLGR